MTFGLKIFYTNQSQANLSSSTKLFLYAFAGKELNIFFLKKTAPYKIIIEKQTQHLKEHLRHTQRTKKFQILIPINTPTSNMSIR